MSLRPAAVTVSSIVMLVLGVFNVIYSFTGIYAPFGLLYTAFHTILTVVMFAGVSGIWSMEKWGFYVFLASIVLKFGLDIYSDAFSWWTLLLLIPTGIYAFYSKSMSS